MKSKYPEPPLPPLPKFKNEQIFPKKFLPLSIQSGSKTFQVKALLDSGSDECLIDENIVNAYQLPLNLLKTPIALFLADGQPASKSHHQVSLILGLDWLRRHNPRINWDDLTIVFRSEYCQDNCTATQPVTCHSVEMTTCSTSRTDPDKLTSQVYPYIGGNEQQISDFPEELTIEYADVFSKSNANKLPAHSEFDFGIDLEPGFHPPHGKVYSLTPKETQVMATYVQEQLDKNFIRPSTSPAAAPCFFVAKKDGDLRPVQDYRGLNAGTIKKRYPLPLISDLLRDLSKGSVFTTLDLRSAYNLIRIKKGTSGRQPGFASKGYSNNK
ncbi:hypothetical protein BASA83_009172 [Batrachochytrium salamandrivorans]|nr:hypothetical protein BASA83_009172 [Batrachochytrium salamandrivorans]